MNKNSEINLKEHKIFFVGGKVQKVKDNNILKGKMYVESFIPAKSNNLLPATEISVKPTG